MNVNYKMMMMCALLAGTMQHALAMALETEEARRQKSDAAHALDREQARLKLWKKHSYFKNDSAFAKDVESYKDGEALKKIIDVKLQSGVAERRVTNEHLALVKISLAREGFYTDPSERMID